MPTQTKDEDSNPTQTAFQGNTTAQNQRYSRYYQKFEDYKTRRNKPVHFFNKNGQDRNIISYVEDSVNRMNEYHQKPDYKEDWQNNVFDPVTRDKLIAILSKLASSRMRPELLLKANSIFNSKGSKTRRAIYQDLLDAANLKNEDEQQLIWEMYTALSEGTVFGFESWVKDTRDVEYVKDYNPATGEKKTEKISIDRWDDVFGQIVPLKEFYPETIWVNNIKALNSNFWAQSKTLDQFKSQYGGFSQASLVQPASFYKLDDELPWGISKDTDNDNVLILQYFDKRNDKLVIHANGTEIYYGCLPWNHKELPFWCAIAEPIHHQFLYGKSLPDKLMGMQDINNAVFNGMLDQLFLSLNSPVVIDGSIDDLGEGYLEPGRIYETSPGARAQTVKLGQIDPASFQMLQVIDRNMQESSISAQAQGVPTGGRKTKFEVQQLQEGALSLASLFLQLMEGSMRKKYWLRLYNILQYYSQPSSVESGKLKFKFIVIENTKLTNGKNGKRMIQIVSGEDEKPASSKLKKIAEQEEGKEFDVMEARVEPVVITREYLMEKDIELEIKIVPNSSIKDSETQKKNKDVAFAQLAMNNPLFDQEETAKDLAKAFDKSEDIVVDQQLPQTSAPGISGQPGQPGIAAGGGQPVPDVDLI